MTESREPSTESEDPQNEQTPKNDLVTRDLDISFDETQQVKPVRRADPSEGSE